LPPRRRLAEAGLDRRAHHHRDRARARHGRPGAHRTEKDTMSIAAVNAPAVAPPSVSVPIAMHAAVDAAGLAVKVSIRNLDFHYGESKALKGISLPLYANKATAFIGPSGCGKSTLLRVLT